MKKVIKKNKKGFTFIELISAIVVLSILMSVGAVSITHFMNSSKKKYYRSQEDLITLSGKQYFSDFRSELPKEIGNKASVDLDTLYSKKYIEKVKDYKGNLCVVTPGDVNKVYAVKVSAEQYQYYTNFKCGDYETDVDNKGPIISFTPTTAITNGKIEVVMKIIDNVEVASYSYEIIKNGVTYETVDFNLYTNPITITLKDEGTYIIKGHAMDTSGNLTNKTSKEYTIDKTAPDCSKINITSTSVQGKWQANAVKLKIIPYDDINKWDFQNCFKSSSGSEICTIDGNNIIGVKTKTLKGAKGTLFKDYNYTDNGHVYGKIKAYDKAGNYCETNTGEYLVDFDAPVITSKSVTSRNSNYNSLDIIIRLTLKDREDTSDDSNIIYYSLSSDNKYYSDWDTYKLGTTTTNYWALGGSYDGTTKTIYIKVKDELGNTKKETLSYKVYDSCNNTYSSTTTGSCSASTGFGTATTTTKFYDEFTNEYCGSSSSTSQCCANSYSYYGSWSNCSTSCGGGTMYRDVTTYDCNGLASYSTQSSSCNTQSCETAKCSSITYKDGTSCSNSCGSGTYNRLAYDSSDGSRCYAYDTSSGGSSCYSSSGCSTPTPSPSTGFTCGSVGSTQSYAGKNWTVVSNSGGQCKLALNQTSSSTGNYNDAYNKLYSEYFSSGTLLTDKNSGKITSISTDSSGASDISGIYWKGSGTIYDSSNRYQYSCKQTALFYGGHMSKGDSEEYYITGCFTKPSSTISSSAGVHYITNASTTYPIANGKVEDPEPAYTPGNYKYTSLYLTEYNPISANTSKKLITYDVDRYLSSGIDYASSPILQQYGNSGNIYSNDLKIYACGGVRTHSYKWHELKYNDKNKFTDIHQSSTATDTYDRNFGDVTYRAAAYAKGLGNQTVIRHDQADDCVTSAVKYTISSNNIPIHYRLTITVKTS